MKTVKIGINLSKKINIAIAFLLALLEVLYIGYIFINGYLAQDHSEHLHAAWLIWQGEVPYRDFFEHHNPLLWYLLAPIMPLFYQNALILYFSRFLNALIFCLMFWGIYRISKDFLKLSRGAFYLALMLYFLNKPFLYYFFELAPDAPMYACFVWGLWWYFNFLKNKQQKALNICFFLLLLSFLFLQKMLLLSFFLGCHILYLLYKKEISIKNILFASILPLVVISLFLIYLTYTYSLQLYFLFNYELNLIMQKFMGIAKTPDDIVIAYISPCLAMLTVHAFLKNKNRYRNILAGIIFAEYIFKMFTWAPWVQYFILTNIICCLIIIDVLLSWKWKKTGKVILYILFLFYIAVFIAERKYNLTYFTYYQAHQYIMKNTTKEDVIINNANYFFNIYGKNASYYWFGYQNIAPVAYYIYEYEDEPNINKMLYKWQPKFFLPHYYQNQIVVDHLGRYNYLKYLEKIYNQVPNHNEGAKAFAKRWGNIIAYDVDLKFLQQNYVITPYYSLLRRKDLITNGK